MKSLLLAIAAAAVATSTYAQYVCDIPTNGCTNGMFNQDACACECIVPYCHDLYGDCTNPSNNCGGNPWVGCERGVDCPWWANPLKYEACTTGPEVPLDLWEIYNTQTACCNSQFPYSDLCLANALSNGPPTKYPTIARPEDDEFEIVPIKFDIDGLPDDVSMRELKDEMSAVLKRILLRLADRIEGLRISEVEERVVLDRNLREVERRLRSETVYFNVYVVRDENKKFGPIIINAIRDSYDEVMEQVQQFADTKFFGGDLNMNWCTSEAGKYDNCVTNFTPRTSRNPPTIRSDDESGGLSGGGIAAIVIFVLLFVCCLGYAIAVMCFGVTNCFLYCCEWGEDDKNREINNIYFDDNRTRASGRTGYTSRRGDRSRRNRGNEDDVEIVCAEPQDPHFDDDSFTINTYGTKQQRQGKDPTMYIPGQEDKPDPDSDILMITGDNSSRRYYEEDPPLKPKRDPTMYVDGNSYMEEPPLNEKRDPTMFMDGERDPNMYGEGDSVEYATNGGGGGYSNADPYMRGIDEEDEYHDDYGYQHSASKYMTSETNAEYAHPPPGRDPTYYQEDEEVSFKTREPSVSGKSGRSKKSKKSKKSSRSQRER